MHARSALHPLKGTENGIVNGIATEGAIGTEIETASAFAEPKAVTDGIRTHTTFVDLYLCRSHLAFHWDGTTNTDLDLWL